MNSSSQYLTKMELPAFLQVFSDENIKKFHIPFIIASVYMVVIRFLAPAYMKNRPPFKMRKVIIAYNFFQVVANLSLAVGLSVTFFPYLKNQCNIVHSERFPGLWKDVRFYIEGMLLMRYVDLLDTLFFVLRKKHGNISFLHVYHHASVPVLFFLAVATLNCGFSLGLGITINSYVHSIMYLYYGFAACGEKFKKYLWWKRYLTMIQITQFVFLLSFWSFNVWQGCERLGKFEGILFIYIGTIFLLFINYYKQAFKSKLNNNTASKEK